MGNILLRGLYIVLRGMSPLSDRQLADALIDEVRLGVVDDVCLFVRKFENKQIFNKIYGDEIRNIYENVKLHKETLETLQKMTYCRTKTPEQRESVETL